MSKLRNYQIKASNKETTAGAWGNGILDSDSGDDGLNLLSELLLGKKGANALVYDADDFGSNRFWIAFFKKHEKEIKAGKWLPKFKTTVNSYGTYGYEAILGVVYIWEKAKFGKLPKDLIKGFTEACKIAFEEAQDYNNPSARKKVIKDLAARVNIKLPFSKEKSGSYNFFK